MSIVHSHIVHSGGTTDLLLGRARASPTLIVTTAPARGIMVESMYVCMYVRMYVCI